MNRSPYRALAVVVAWIAVTGLVSGMIGQDNEGPWGGLPDWLGAITWFGFLLGVLALLLLLVYLVVATVRRRSRAT